MADYEFERSPVTLTAAWRGQKGCGKEGFMKIVNCGVCREGLIDAHV